MLRLKIAGVALALAAAAGGWLVLRDTSVFAVQKVTITGLAGPQAPAIRTSLEDAARTMTTTHLSVSRLRAAVASYAVVKDLRVATQLPHGLRIAVVEENPVAALMAGGQTLPVAGDGRVVRGVAIPPGLAAVPLAALPTGDRISDRVSFAAVELLDIAPPALRARVSRVTIGAHGLTAELWRGPPLYFGDTTRLHAKWAAAARVLADPSARGARYVDLHTPERPAAQVGDPATAGAAADAPGTVSGALVTGTAPGG